jgi:hypothetical protein
LGLFHLPVAIDAGAVRQTLREVSGGNFIHFFGGVTSALDPVSTLNMDTLNPQVARDGQALLDLPGQSISFLMLQK